MISVINIINIINNADLKNLDPESAALAALVGLYDQIRAALDPDSQTILGLSFTEALATVWVGGPDVDRLVGVGLLVPAKNPQLRLLEKSDLQLLADRGFTVWAIHINPLKED